MRLSAPQTACAVPNRLNLAPRPLAVALQVAWGLERAKPVTLVEGELINGQVVPLEGASQVGGADRPDGAGRMRGSASFLGPRCRRFRCQIDHRCRRPSQDSGTPIQDAGAPNPDSGAFAPMTSTNFVTFMYDLLLFELPPMSDLSGYVSGLDSGEQTVQQAFAFQNSILQ
jgi:hypothetical protein